ncbi:MULTISPECIES: class I SAM-dependent methyltransferase [unclassified Halorubrum]|uniref:class I SAM-dependent methyltransferase n=1 Tax=unclassified Halorubrum TaxID=2642239 RepID=UPI000A2E6C71|nr:MULTISPECIES: class I SAM-dependent methyltransferase [unclassified Halorubrum]OTE99660.1 SAM-dependent methyltransferase [Halorubrum sp. SD683]TKX36332.1 class I SAM-dependent methyltransferase [Halorubrum sp. CGM5_25_10-8B]TKX44447.1 class I SAM-dependent methyltransferase [Halorubrum sp. SD690R]
MDPQPTGDPQSTYDRIATHFSKTRQYAWPEVESFLEGRSGGLALDVGCGNGRHTEALAARTETAVGLDLSRGLLAEATARARDRGFADATAFVHGDATALPVRDGAVDLAVYVATLHHLSPRSARVESLNELARVLAPGGVALVSAWSTAHERFDRDEGFDTTVDWTLPGGETVPRYYHIYSPAEFETDLGESALETRRTELSSGNCYAEVEPERP